MKIILRQDVQNIGKRGDVKKVSPGYARNFLIPRQLAWEANEGNMKLLEREKVKIQKQLEQEIAEAKIIAEKIEKNSYTITVKVGDAGKLFGSVTNADVAKVIAEAGFEIEKNKVILEEPLKEVGVFTVAVKVHPEVTANAKIWIVEEK